MIRSLTRLVLLATLALSASGCIQLTGQRLAWHHDAQANTFTALLFYDGIHDKSDTPREIENSKNRLREFVAAGDIMLLDWYGELKIGSIKDLTEAELERQPDVKAILPLVKMVQTQAIGHYTESDQIGGAQYVRINQVSKFLELLNAHFSVLAMREKLEEEGRSPERQRSVELRHKYAAQQFMWLALDGQAIVVSVPYDPDDWARTKGEILSKMFQGMLKTPPEPTQPGERQSWEAARMLAQTLAATPVSLDDRGEVVRFTFGHRDRSPIVRARIRDHYNPHHVETVKQAIPQSLNGQIVAALTGGQTGEAIQAVIAFGPPEVTMLALAEAAEDGNAKALEVLRERARAWNKAGRFPAIRNVESELPINTINGIKDWHAAMKRYPMDQDDLQLPPKEPAEPDPAVEPDDEPEL